MLPEAVVDSSANPDEQVWRLFSTFTFMNDMDGI